MTRIVFIVPWGEALGGAELMLLTLLKHLDRSRVEPAVILLRAGSFTDDVARLAVPSAVVPVARLRHTRSLRRSAAVLAGQLDELVPDVICAWAAKSHVHATLARRKRSTRSRPAYLWWQHCITRGEWLDRLATALPADAIGCSSQAAATAQRALRPHRATFVVHPGIAPHSGGQQPGAVIREELGIPCERFVVAITGRLQPGKNHLRLLEAIGMLRSEGLPAHALIVGGTAHGLSADYPAEIDRLVRRLGLEAHVSRLGHVVNARRLLPAVDVLVNPSENEAFGISLIEAMAAGVPVIAVNSGGPTEIVQNGRSGLLVPSSSAHDLAAGMRSLVTDVALKERLSRGAVRRYEERFTAELMAQRFATEIERLVR